MTRPGTILSQMPRNTAASKVWWESATAVERAITSRENRLSSMPASPWVTPSHMAGTPPATCAVPPASRAAVAAVMARFTRASFVDVLHEDYMRTARAKGVSETRVVLKHGLRNAMIPVVTMMGLQFGFLLGGSIVVEKVFNWPGLGRLLVDSVEMRDYPVIQAEVLLFSLEFILINLVVDVLYAAINPAIRYK